MHKTPIPEANRAADALILGTIQYIMLANTEAAGSHGRRRALMKNVTEKNKRFYDLYVKDLIRSRLVSWLLQA